MNRIVHLALKVDDLEKTTKFYEEVFGFWEAETRKTRDHLSRHLTDGEIDFTLIKYDAGTQSAESRAAGDGPCIHHFAIEVEDMDKATEQIKSHGCELISDPGVVPVKFRAPGGTVAELVPVGRYKKPDRTLPAFQYLRMTRNIGDDGTRGFPSATTPGVNVSLQAGVVCSGGRA